MQKNLYVGVKIKTNRKKLEQTHLGYQYLDEKILNQLRAYNDTK